MDQESDDASVLFIVVQSAFSISLKLQQRDHMNKKNNKSR